MFVDIIGGEFERVFDGDASFMNRVLIFLSVLSSLVLLCQWYVFSRIRKYLFQRYSPVNRTVAYPALLLLGLVNIVGIKVALAVPVQQADSTAQQVASIVFFTYLGLCLFLSLFFLLVAAANVFLDLTGSVASRFSELKDRTTTMAGSESGYLASCRSVDSPRSASDTLPCGRRKAENTLDVVECHHGEFCDRHRRDKHKYHSVSRRNFLKWGTAAGIVAGTGFAGEGIVQAYSPPIEETFDVSASSLAELARPVRLIHVTDFHFGMFYGVPELERLVGRLNSMDGEAVLFTGDIYHSPLSPVEQSVPVLKQLRPRKLGNLAVLGNHDFYTGVVRVVSALEEASVSVLRDQWMSFSLDGCMIQLGGIDDPMANWLWGTNFPGFASFVEKAPASPAFKVLLSHRPAIFPTASEAGIDLVLSGHTHGGQIIIPVASEKRGVSLARLVSRFTHGWYRINESRMYLNRGVGLTFVPWRVNCPPEIAVISLLSPSSYGTESKAQDAAESRERS